MQALGRTQGAGRPLCGVRFDQRDAKKPPSVADARGLFGESYWNEKRKDYVSFFR